MDSFLTQNYPWKKHVIKICQTAYFELKHISSIHRFLTEDATKTLVTFYIFSHGLITAAVSSWAHPNLSSNLSRKFRTLLQDSSSWHLLQKLHWHPISECIKYKVACMCFQFHAINGSGPTQLSEPLHIICLCLTRFALLQILTCSKSHSTNARLKAFVLSLTLDPMGGTHTCIHDIRQCSFLPSFKTKLKTFLFSQYFKSS